MARDTEVPPYRAGTDVVLDDVAGSAVTARINSVAIPDPQVRTVGGDR
jgi:hypothetical protein